MIRWTVLCGAVLCSGCTFEDGQGFATIESAKLSARFDAGVARNLNGAILTDQGYQVRLDTLVLAIDSAELLELQTSGEQAGSFDPAHPPAGYSLCHGGHCHAADGSLVSYADVEAASGGSAQLRSVATFEVSHDFDLLAGAERNLTRITPSRELPETTLRKVRVLVSKLTATGSVSAGPLAENSAVFSVDLAGGVPALETGIDLDISRDGPENLNVTLAFALTGTLFDGVDFATLATAGAVDISDPDSAAALSISTALRNTALSFNY